MGWSVLCIYCWYVWFNLSRSPRFLGALSCAISNFSAVMIVTIAVTIQDRPTAAPQTGHWESDWELVKGPSFTKAMAAVSSIVYSYSGTPGFFPIAAEMRDPTKYTKALLVCQGFVTAMYIAIGCVVYYYCGSYVATPALGSAGVLVKKVAYGIALPGLLVSTIIVHHVSVNTGKIPLLPP